MVSTHAYVSDMQEQGDELTRGDRGHPGVGCPPPTHLHTPPHAPSFAPLTLSLPYGNNTMFLILSRWSLSVSGEQNCSHPVNAVCLCQYVSVCIYSHVLQYFNFIIFYTSYSYNIVVLLFLSITLSATRALSLTLYRGSFLPFEYSYV